MQQLSNSYRQGDHCRLPLSKQYLSQRYRNGVKID